MADHGRPTRHTRAVARRICAELAAGKSLRAVCEAEDLPHESTVRGWVVDDYKEFSTQYARARDTGLEVMADELLEISDDGTNDWMKRNGHDVVNGEVIGRSRLRVDTRKWLLSKMAPKRYGDRVALTGEGGGPLVVQVVSFADDTPSGK